MYQNIYDCKAYACYLKDRDALQKSTSGGAFFALAENIINKDGVVFGAAFQENFQVCHISAETLDELEKLRKSKYVQSRILDTYREARTLLENGRLVLFSGTPCQIAGLKSFLGKDYDTLYTVDVICHGVPSHKLLKGHIEQLETTYGPIKEIQFRDKQNGWRDVSVSYQLQDEKKVVKCYGDAYFYGFDKYYFLRPSCYDCKFRGMRSGADITIGDYWGIWKEHPDFTNDDQGISCVIIKSSKGNFLFESCQDKFIYLESTVQKIANYNIWVTGTPGMRKTREKFYGKWLAGEKDLSTIYQFIEKGTNSVNLAVIGSYSSRSVAFLLHFYDLDIKVGCHITNSGICSMISDQKCEINISDLKISNEYRRESIRNDIEKNFSSRMTEPPFFDYIILDFLEERFPLLFLEDNSVITESEAYREIQDQVVLPRNKRVTILDLSDEYWKKCCDQFIRILSWNYKPEQIILNRFYLVENFGSSGPEHAFSNLAEIRQINERLNEYYDYFIENMPGIHVISIMHPEHDFCHEGWAYQCEPVYYDRELLCEVRKKIIEIMEGIS